MLRQVPVVRDPFLSCWIDFPMRSVVVAAGEGCVVLESEFHGRVFVDGMTSLQRFCTRTSGSVVDAEVEVAWGEGMSPSLERGVDGGGDGACDGVRVNRCCQGCWRWPPS